METVKNHIWVLKPSWEEEEEPGMETEPETRKRKRKGKGKEEEVAKVEKVEVPEFGGAICFDSSGLLLTTISAIITITTPNLKNVYKNVLKKVTVRARSCGGVFRDAVYVESKQGLVVYQIPKTREDEMFEFADLNELNNVELTLLERVFSFVQSGGNYSFRRAINNFPLPRVFEDILNTKEFPYFKPSLPLIQVSNLGEFMSSGMSGCPVFNMDKTNYGFVGLIAFCVGQFTLVIPYSTIRDVLLKIKQKKKKDEYAHKKMKKGGRGGGGKGGGGLGGGDWQGGGGRGGCGGRQGGGGVGGRGKGGGARGRGGRGEQGGKGKGPRVREGGGGGGGVSGFNDDGWTLLNCDGAEDAIIACNSAKPFMAPLNGANSLPVVGGVLCAKASMLLENVPPAGLVRFLREHRSELAGFSVDAYSAAALKANLYAFPEIQAMRFSGSQIIMLLGHTIEHEEMLEVICLEGHSRTAEDAYMSEDIHLFQDNPTNRTLDLTSIPEAGPPTNQGASDATISGSTRSLLTIVFQLPFESNLQESVATVARQYVRSVISSVQRVATAITPSDLTPTVGPKLSPGSPESLTLVHWICKIYSCPEKGFYHKTQTGGRCNSFMALHYGQQIAQETSGEVVYGFGRPVLRTFSQRLNRVNDAINEFSDDGWTLLNCDGAEDVIIACNSAKPFIATLNGAILLPVVVVLCAMASMLLQNVPPTVLVRLLREHLSEWADFTVDAYSAAALKANSYAFPGMRVTIVSGSQIIMPLDRTIEHEEDNLTNRTLDLTLSLEMGSPTNQGASDAATSGSTRSVLTIAFQLLFDNNLQESVATMAHQYVRSVISSVQRVAMAITPSGLTPTVGPKLYLGSLEALILVHWICKSYCCHMGIKLLQTSSAID